MNFLLGFLSLLAIGVRVLVMCIALVVITAAEWLERAQEWADRKRGLPIVQVGDEEPVDLPHEFDDLARRVLWHRGQADMIEAYMRGETHPAPPLNDSVRACGRCGQTPGVCECP